MKQTEFLNDLVNRLCEALPSGLKNAKKDMEKNFRAIIQSAFGKLELVTREEFDAQAKVLLRTRKKLELLEKQIKEIERLMQESPRQ